MEARNLIYKIAALLLVAISGWSAAARAETKYFLNLYGYYNLPGSNENPPGLTPDLDELVSKLDAYYKKALPYYFVTLNGDCELEPIVTYYNLPPTLEAEPGDLQIAADVSYEGCGKQFSIMAQYGPRNIDLPNIDSCDVPETSCGNPINLAYETKYQHEVDYSLPGFIDLDRYYVSGYQGYRLPKWFWLGDQKLIFMRSEDGSPAFVKAFRRNGSVWAFTKSADGWVNDYGTEAKLSFNANNKTYSIKLSGDEETYNENGKLSSILRRGNIIELGRDNFGRIEHLSSQDGRKISLSYKSESSTFPSQACVSNDGCIAYEINENEVITKVIFQDGGSKSYLYSSGTYLVGIVDENTDRYATYSYQTTSGSAISTKHGASADNYSVSYNNASGSKQAIVTTPTGSTRTIEFTKLANGINSVTQLETSCQGCATVDYKFDINEKGRILKRYSPSGAGSLNLSYERDVLGRTIRTTNLLGLDKLTSYNDEENAPSKIEWRSDGVPQRDILITYDNRAQLVKVESRDLKSNNSRSYSFSRCDGTDLQCPIPGLLLSQDGPRIDVSDITNFSYFTGDDTGCGSYGACRYRKGYINKVTNALGQVIEVTDYNGAGRPLSVKDPNGVITDYEYHPRGWLTATKVRGADSSTESDDRITRIDYWPTGLVKRVTQPDGAFTTYTYDAAHRLTDISDNAGNTIHYTLDNAGNRIAEDTKDANGNLKRTLSRVYNQLGQLATQADAVGNPTDYGYDANGNTTSATDALSRITQSEYDPLNRLKRTLQDVGGIAAETKFAYDALDNLTEVTDPKGLKTTYTYNGLGELTKQVSPDTGTTLFTYDSAGNRITQKDARSKTTTYSYDALNRLAGIAYANTSFNVTYTYDANQSVCTAAESFPVGRLTKMQDGSGTTQYCYNRFGDLTRKVQTVNGVALTLRYSYAPGGQLTAMTYPDGAVVDYVRDSQGRITEVGVKPSAGARQVLLTGATYHPFGPAAGWTYGNGRQMTRTLDLDYRPAAIHDASTGGLAVGFNYDEVGNLVELTQPGSTLPQVGFGYDALGRLTQFKDGPTGTVIDGYGYDKTGNRTSLSTAAGTSTYSYPTTSHRLTNVGGIARTYDAAGNTTGINGTAKQFVYDDTGRMSSVKAGGTTTRNYKYNGKGERVRSYLSTANTYTLYDEAGHWIGDYGANGTPVQQAIWMDDLPVGLRTAAAGTVSYIEPDHLGSPRVVIDPVANTSIWEWDIKGEVFGATAPKQDPDADGVSFNLDLRLPGQRYDGATGFYYNFFRDYDPSAGRYIQSDPIGLNGGISTFSYVDSSPLSLADFFGLQITMPWVSPMVRPAPIPGPIDVAPFLAPRTPRDPFGEYCQSLIRRIQNTKDEIYNKRIPALAKDPNPLPRRIGPGERLRDTIRGHEKLLNRRLRDLKDLEDEYDRECGPATLACESKGAESVTSG
ncbi:RHS repeat-associated core domain-containing protein [Pseudoxanthomonas winnipegensis]|nr:RHS repeat-associated core domain-containing protein [Pseudoxanthomonas winnipegensis]